MSEANGKYVPKPGQIPGAVVNLGGHEFVLAPFGLRLTREYEAKFNELAKRTDPPASPEEHYDLAVEAIVCSLQRNYPEVTRERIEDLLDNANVPEALSALLAQSGLKRLTPGEIPAANR